MQFEVFHVSSVVRIHDSIPDIRVMDTQWVTEFMSSNPQKVCITGCSIGKCFIFIKVRAAIWGEEGVCEYFAFSVEWVAAFSFWFSTVISTSKAENEKTERNSESKLKGLRLNRFKVVAKDMFSVVIICARSELLTWREKSRFNDVRAKIFYSIDFF